MGPNISRPQFLMKSEMNLTFIYYMYNFWPKTLYTPNHSIPEGTKNLHISNFPCHSCFKQSSKRCTWKNWTLLDLPPPSGCVPSLGLLPMIHPLSRQHVFHLPGLLYMVALAHHEGLKGWKRSTLSSPSSRKHLLPRGWMHRVFNLSSIQTHLSMSLVSYASCHCIITSPCATNWYNGIT